MYHFLRAARKYAAKCKFLITAKRNHSYNKSNIWSFKAPGDYDDSNDIVSSLNLDFKKWKLDDQEALNDFVSSGWFDFSNFYLLYKYI